MTANNEKANITLSKILTAKIKELGINPRQLAISTDMAYDRVRKACKGDTFPGPKTLKKLCDALDLNFEEMLALKDIEQNLDKGYVAIDLVDTLDKDATLARIASLWNQLGKKDKDDILSIVSSRAFHQK